MYSNSPDSETQTTMVMIILRMECTRIRVFLIIRPKTRNVIEVANRVNGMDSLIKCKPTTLLRKNIKSIATKNAKLHVKNFLVSFILTSFKINPI